MAHILLFAVELGLGVALTAWVVRRDMRRLDEVRLDRTWNDASFWSAVVGFGPLCIPVHFVKARRSLGGCLLGLLWAAFVIVATSVAVTLLAVALGAP
jgi:hypothetical protein